MKINQIANNTKDYSFIHEFTLSFFLISIKFTQKRIDTILTNYNQTRGPKIMPRGENPDA